MNELNIIMIAVSIPPCIAALIQIYEYLNK